MFRPIQELALCKFCRFELKSLRLSNITIIVLEVTRDDVIYLAMASWSIEVALLWQIFNIAETTYSTSINYTSDIFNLGFSCSSIFLKLVLEHQVWWSFAAITAHHGRFMSQSRAIISADNFCTRVSFQIPRHIGRLTWNAWNHASGVLETYFHSHLQNCKYTSGLTMLQSQVSVATAIT